MIVKLTQLEREFLLKDVLEKNTLLMEIIKSATPYFDKFSVDIQADIADQIRDLCADKLMMIGFDEEYKLTKEGVLLEHLIDIFFNES